MSVKSKKAEQSGVTRQALIKAARALFARDGFAATATESVVQAAGVTRGALYHHFADKRELFEAAFRDLERELVERLAAQVLGGASPLEQLRKGAALFLDACLDPEVQQIALTDAPAVLGWKRWREIDAEYGLGVIKSALQLAIDSGEIAPQPVEAVSHVLLGALDEAAMLLAASEDRDTLRPQLEQTFDRLLEGLKQS